MAQLGVYRETIFDSAGAPLGESVGSAEIRVQGATCKTQAVGTGNVAVTVDNPGRFAIGNNLTIYESDGETQVSSSGGTTAFTVSNVTATTITIASGYSGTLTVDPGDRLVNDSDASLFSDAEGNDSKGNPLSTDDNGMVWAWLEANYYDVLISDGSTTKILYDVVVSGDKRTVNQRSSLTIPAYEYDTEFAIADTHPLVRWGEEGDPKVTIYGSGKVQMDGQLDVDGGADIEGDVSINGALSDLTGLTTVSGGATIVGNSTIAGTLGSVTDLTAESITVSAGGATVTGNITANDSIIAEDEIYIKGVETIASANSISVAAGTTIVQLTGATNVLTINLGGGAPGAGDDGRVLIFRNSDTGSITLNTGGNIYSAKALADGDAAVIRWNNTNSKWEWIARF